MCGFSVFLNYEPYLKHLFSAEKRGGDESRILKIDNLVFVFHRLSINGVEDGSQPFVKDGLVLVCNGEIYNYKHLYEKHDLPLPDTKSDCVKSFLRCIVNINQLILLMNLMAYLHLHSMIHIRNNLYIPVTNTVLDHYMSELIHQPHI
jgi:hypothetical protein